MKILVILNGISRKKNFFYRRLGPALSERFPLTIRETEYAGHAELLAGQATLEGFTHVFAAGGDGTMHHVLNGICASGSQDRAVVGLIPLGRGNDFARTLGLKADSGQLLSLIEGDIPRSLDVGIAMTTINGATRTRFFMNECSVGMGPDVVRRMNHERKTTPPSIRYLLAILATFFTSQARHVTYTSDSLNWSGMTRVLTIANGRCFGHAIYIAPDAKPDDGSLNVFVAGDPPLWRFLLLLQKLKRPEKVVDRFITYSTALSATVKSELPLQVEADGELIGLTPLHCQVAPGMIRFLC